MKREFKLIKEYPGSPKKGAVITESLRVTINNSRTANKEENQYTIKVDSQHCDGCRFNIKNPQDFPEFWQEVTKDYEILSFTNEAGSIFTRTEDRRYWLNHHPFTERWLIDNKDMFIHSVKRLKDGQIFTVGDLIERSREYKVYNTIKKIEFGSDLGSDLKIRIDFEKASNKTEEHGYNRFAWLNELRKPEEEKYLIESFIIKLPSGKEEVAYIRDQGGYSTIDDGITYPALAYLNETSKANGWRIRSVMRIEDKEVFKLGDFCAPDSVITNRAPIDKIEFCKAGYLRFQAKDKYYVGIDNLVKLEVILNTRDGVNKYKGDKVYWTKEDIFSTTNIPIRLSAGYRPKPDMIYFDSKDLLQDYITTNKPLLSHREATTLSHLEMYQLVKSRLNFK